MSPFRLKCRCLGIHPSGFYEWLMAPVSRRAQEDARQTELIRQAWADSGKVYGYRKLTDDLRDSGETISENRTARLASRAGIAAQVGYRCRPVLYGGNVLDRQFHVSEPDQVWVTDITYIRAHGGWLYLSVAVDPFLRCVVGWSAQPRMTTDCPCRPCSWQSGEGSQRTRCLSTVIRVPSSPAENGRYFSTNTIWKLA